MNVLLMNYEFIFIMEMINYIMNGLIIHMMIMIEFGTKIMMMDLLHKNVCISILRNTAIGVGVNGVMMVVHAKMDKLDTMNGGMKMMV